MSVAQKSVPRRSPAVDRRCSDCVDPPRCDVDRSTAPWTGHRNPAYRMPGTPAAVCARTSNAVTTPGPGTGHRWVSGGLVADRRGTGTGWRPGRATYPDGAGKPLRGGTGRSPLVWAGPAFSAPRPVQGKDHGRIGCRHRPTTAPTAPTSPVTRRWLARVGRQRDGRRTRWHPSWGHGWVRRWRGSLVRRWAQHPPSTTRTGGGRTSSVIGSRCLALAICSSWSSAVPDGHQPPRPRPSGTRRSCWPAARRDCCCAWRRG